MTITLIENVHCFCNSEPASGKEN